MSGWSPDQFFGEYLVLIYIVSAKAIVNVNCPPFHPAKFCKRILKSRNLFHHFCIDQLS